MNWLQILQKIAVAIPAIEALTLDAVQLITAVAHGAAQAPAANQAAIADAAAKLAK